MNKRIYILIVIALFGLASIWITGNVVILILSVLGQIVALLMGNTDKETFKSIGGVFTTANRPTLVSLGTMIFDSTLQKPIWKANSGWVDGAGTPS